VYRTMATVKSWNHKLDCKTADGREKSRDTQSAVSEIARRKEGVRDYELNCSTWSSKLSSEIWSVRFRSDLFAHIHIHHTRIIVYI